MCLNPKLTLLVVSLAKKSQAFSVVLVDLKWHKATTKEFQALIDHHTWELVNPSHPIKVVGDKWVLRIKYEILVMQPKRGVNWDSKNYSIFKAKLNANIKRI